MKPWHTIFILNPNSRLAKGCQRNSAGQCIAFDGPASTSAAITAAKQLFQECTGVQVFRGKNLGKLVFQLP